MRTISGGKDKPKPPKTDSSTTPKTVKSVMVDAATDMGLSLNDSDHSSVLDAKH